MTDDHRVTRSRWHVRFTATELPQSRSLPSTDDNLHAEAWPDWLRRTRQTPGTPFLLSPSFDYDPDLNDFFRSAAMSTMASTTQVGYARDIASFLTFVNHVNSQRLWRDVSEDDHLTYLHWRRHDPEGPRVGGNTWNRDRCRRQPFLQVGPHCRTRQHQSGTSDVATAGPCTHWVWGESTVG